MGWDGMGWGRMGLGGAERNCEELTLTLTKTRLRVIAISQLWIVQPYGNDFCCNAHLQQYSLQYHCTRSVDRTPWRSANRQNRTLLQLLRLQESAGKRRITLAARTLSTGKTLIIAAVSSVPATTTLTTYSPHMHFVFEGQRGNFRKTSKRTQPL